MEMEIQRNHADDETKEGDKVSLVLEYVILRNHFTVGTMRDLVDGVLNAWWNIAREAEFSRYGRVSNPVDHGI